MAVQTTTHVQLLSQILKYFELAAMVGMEIPEPHVRAISMVVEAVASEIESGVIGSHPIVQALTPQLATGPQLVQSNPVQVNTSPTFVDPVPTFAQSPAAPALPDMQAHMPQPAMFLEK